MLSHLKKEKGNWWPVLIIATNTWFLGFKSNIRLACLNLGGCCQLPCLKSLQIRPLYNFQQKLDTFEGLEHLQVSGTLSLCNSCMCLRAYIAHIILLSTVVPCFSKCVHTQVSLFPGTSACMPLLLVQMNGATQAVGANFSNYQTHPNAFTTMPIISKSHNWETPKGNKL